MVPVRGELGPSSRESTVSPIYTFIDVAAVFIIATFIIVTTFIVIATVIVIKKYTQF